ncbi:SURF1 family protein [Parahaliea mediterranea]|uniref:SURF1-like protein n=1 Tax=Parahaliea mediterranea TaxID=651086 RepID=A0A939IMK4_9GAMM|nr:SURF1 family protein [Parahaliea mediterranea]
MVLLPVLVSLGFWQLERAEDKRAIAAVHEQRRAAGPVELDALWEAPADELAFRRVTVTGRFDPERYLLLDNRIREGQFGYEVVAVLEIADSNRAVLVNRGWVAGDSARRSLPRIEQPRGLHTLSASIYVAPGEAYLLGEQALDGGWPIVLQALEMDKLAPVLGRRLERELFPRSLRLSAVDPAALRAGWSPVNVSPAKHTGYAVQWFCMAAVLLLVFLLRSSNLWQLLRRRTGEN